MQSSHPVECICPHTTACTRWPPVCSASERYNNFLALVSHRPGKKSSEFMFSTLSHFDFASLSVSYFVSILMKQDHILHKEFTTLPSGRRLRCPLCKTNRFKNSLMPVTVCLLNNTWSVYICIHEVCVCVWVQNLAVILCQILACNGHPSMKWSMTHVRIRVRPLTHVKIWFRPRKHIRIRTDQ